MFKDKKLQTWIFTSLLILFIAQIFLLPVFIGVTYASKNRSPEHTITYSGGKLIWDKNTELNSDGVAMLNIFDPEYVNIKSDNGENVVAPGEGKDIIIRLQNNVRRKIQYTAVLYEINEGNLPIYSELSGEGFSDTETYALPKDVENANVIRAVSGELFPKNMQEFDIAWFWNFESSTNTENRDIIDTYFGDNAANGNAENIELGFYIIVTDNGEEITPELPNTGFNTEITLYLILMLTSGVTLIILAIERKRNYAQKNY